MRLFVAIEIPEEIKAPLEAWADRAVAPPEWRIVPSEKRHITLAFLGEVADQDLRGLRIALDEVRLAPMDLRVFGYGGFPDEEAARVFWAGLDGDITQLKELAYAVTLTVQTFAPKIAARRFVPHITLARTDEPQAIGKLSPIDTKIWTADTFCLVESSQTPEGTVYTTLQRYG